MPTTSARCHRILVSAAVLAALTGLVTITSTAAQADPATEIGYGISGLALANVGNTACSENSDDKEYYGTSCTGGSGGQPEHWSADFAEWVWANEGMDVAGLTTATGGSTPKLFNAYGASQSTLHTATTYQPQPGDVAIYDSPADFVAIVTSVDPTNGVTTVAGDWGGTGPGSSSVQQIQLGAGESAVGQQPSVMSGKTIAAYVTPVRSPSFSASLIPFGAITWTPPGSSASRLDVYAADSSGQLWDYSTTPGAGATLPSIGQQVGSGFGHYRPVGVVDWNHDGYPDLVVIDTTTLNMEVFEGAAGGLSRTPVSIGSGWSGNFRPLGVADWNHTGHLGVLTMDTSTGAEYFYPGDLAGGSGSRIQTGSGWTSSFTTMGLDDFTGDGHVTTLACNAGSGALMMYLGDGTGGAANASKLINGCTDYTFFGLADVNGDTHPDLIVRNNSTGDLVINPGNGGLSTATTIGTTLFDGNVNSWQPFGAWTTPSGSPTPRADVYAADPSGNVYDDEVNPVTGSSTVLADPVATGFTHYRSIGAADWNHDGYPDLVVIDTTTAAEDVFLGSATGFATTPVQIGSGWSSAFRPFGVSDWNGTGHSGVVTINQNNGNLYYYPGDLTGGSGSPVQIGNGWTTTDSPVGVGDIDHDGQPDLLDCRTDLNYMPQFLRGSTGTLNGSASTAEVGCGPQTFFGLTDLNNDGYPDLIVRDPTTGALIIDAGNGQAGWLINSPPPIATGW